jgi:hypothetical protein
MFGVGVLPGRGVAVRVGEGVGGGVGVRGVGVLGVPVGAFVGLGPAGAFVAVALGPAGGGGGSVGGATIPPTGFVSGMSSTPSF